MDNDNILLQAIPFQFSVALIFTVPVFTLNYVTSQVQILFVIQDKMFFE